jgi:hypothetical protein
MFKPVNRSHSLLAALFSLSGCANIFLASLISRPSKSAPFYFSDPIDPGEHHHCGSIQAKPVEAYSAAVSFSATAGHVNYFTTKDPNHPTPKEQVKLVALDPAKADLYIASSPLSTFHQKK